MILGYIGRGVPMGTVVPGGPARFIPHPTAAPFAAGQFHCEGGRCIPTDQAALASVTVLFRQLGIGARPRDGLDAGAVRAVNGLVQAGALPGVRMFVSVADLARNLGAVVQALKLRTIYRSGGLGAPDAAAVFRRVAAAKRKAAIPAIPKKKAPESVLVRPKRTAPGSRPVLTRAQVRALQQALGAAGQPVRVDGVLGKETIAAVNRLQVAFGKPVATATEIVVFYDSLMKLLRQKAEATAAIKEKGTAQKTSTPTVEQAPRQVVLPVGAKVVSDFACKGKVCRPMSDEAAKRVVQVQTILNSFPSTVMAAYAKPVKVDGVIGPATVDAVRVVLRFAGQRVGKVVDEKTIRGLTSKDIADRIGDFAADLNAEAEAQRTLFAQQVASGIVPQAALSFKLVKGAAVGNAAFRCMVMALQTQLNRLGQNLRIDGALGGNTVASANAVLKPTTAITVPLAARDIQALVKLAKEAADRAGAPPPPAKTMRIAIAKCKLEARQPIVDARLFGSDAVAQPTVPPTPKPTPTGDQPTPKVDPSVIARLDALKAEAIKEGLPEAVAQRAITDGVARGMNEVQLRAMLQALLDAQAEPDREGRTGPPVRRRPGPSEPPGEEIVPAPGEPPAEGEEAPAPPAPPAPPVAPPEESIVAEAPSDNTWKWMLGALAGLGVIGGGVFLATRRKRGR